MNNIYKVIWSKAKNCYVVASEIARSHTKSASGSEKIGGVARHALLALGAACAIACGGFVNVGAADTVDVTTGGSTATVYTKEGTEFYVAGEIRYLTEYGDVVTNKNNIATLQNTTTEQGKQIAINTTNIATNKADINALQSELGNKADATALDTKADKSYVDTEVGKVDGKLANKADKATTLAGDGITDAYTKAEVDTAVAGAVATAGTNVDTKLADYAKTADVYNKTEVDGKIADEVNARNNAITAAITQEKNDRNAAINTAINGEVTNRNQAIHDAIAQEVTDRNAAVTNAKAELQNKITAEETARTNADNAFNTRLTTAEGKIGANETAIGELKAKDTELEGKINTLDGSGVKYDTAVKDKITLAGADGTTITNLKDAALNESSTDAVTGKQLNKTNENLAAEETARTAKDNELEGKITKNSQDITKLKEKDIELEGNIQTNANNIQANANDIAATNKRTAGIKRNDATNETTIEGNVTVDNLGNVKAKGDVTAEGKLKGAGLEAGAVNAGSLKVENASQLKGDVTMDKTLKVTGDTSLKNTDVGGALNVTGASDLKGNVILGTNAANTVTVNGTAHFNEAVNMDNGLTVDKGLKVTNGETNLQNTTVDGDLKVTGTITTKKMVFGDPATNNYTEIDQGKVTSKNSYVNGEGQLITSSSIFNAEENKVGFANNATGDQSFHKQTSDVIMDNVKDRDNSNNRTQTKTETKDIITDKDGNSSTTSQTASKNETYLKDKDGKNTNSTIDTAKGYDKTIKGENGETSTKQDELNITNTAQNGTITNDAQNIVNNASGNITNKANTMDTNVTGKATESYGSLDTTVNGNETHIVKGTKTETVDGKVTENYKAGQATNVTGDQDIHVTGKQTNKIDGNQENTIGGNQTTTVTGDISNTAKNITNEATEKLTDKVGDNTRVTTSTSITDTVGTANRRIENGKITDTAGDFTVTTDKANGTTFAKTGSTAFSTKAGAPTDTNIAGNLITTGRVDANELGVSDKDGTNTADLSVKAGEGVKASAGNGTTTGSLDVKADEVGSSVTDADGKGSTFKQRIDAIMGNVKTDAGESEVTQEGNKITSVVGKGEATNSRVTQKKGSLEAAVTDGTKVNKQQDNLDSSEKTITNGTYKTSTLQSALDITHTAKDGTITNDANHIVNTAKTMDTTVTGKATESYGELETTVKGKETHNVTGDQVNTIGGNQTTNVTGDISNTAKNITNEASNSITDKVGDHTRVLDSDGITDTVGGSTFKQRIDKIMMESKDVSIKAEETLTNEAKVITNKASEVINNEAININNTATGIITSKASEIKNQADKLISNKVGENTWENMENGKITTSIKDGAKQNLTQSDAAGTTQSTVDGGKSTVTIQNADGLADAVTDGTNTSLQNQTASAIAADVKDGAGNENASVATATTSANTIKSGSKANTVISTADGTSFINSEAAAPVGDGTEVKTTIKGNTITTGKVTMDYAEVMKDLGVHGNAKVDQNLEVGGTSTLKGDVTMESNATVKNNLTVEGTTTTKTLKVTENATVGGTLDVTQKATFGDSVSIAKDLSVGGNATITGDVTANSYKVGDKTYISADGINANDQKITNVADGSISEGSKDAVNGGQLYGVKRDLEHQVDKVGANAAAMANLRPMEFDPSSKWNIAAAIGNYGSETAAALGAFYRPNDDVMVNLSTAFGTGENMVGGGVSVRLGKGSNKLSREENNALKAQVDDLTARMDALLSVLNPNMSKDFPDVPENHWAYEAVSRLAGNDIVQGYPDGEFHGDRTMTRYEMAEIIYNALSRGAEAERELVEEFKPELQAMAASEKATAEKAEG